MLLLLALLALGEPSPGAPAMVTTVQGNVTLVEGGSRTAAPRPPFLLTTAQRLELATGARVVLLRQGGAFAVDGPRTVDPAAFTPGPAADPVSSALAKKTSLAVAGASRASGFSLTRPVAGAPALALHDLRWRCEGCGEQAITLSNLREGGTVWTATARDGLAYTGPILAPGAYSLAVGGREFLVRIVDGAEAGALVEAAHLDALPEADRAAALASAYLLGGFPTDALHEADRSGDAALVAGIEAAAGVVP